MGAPKWHDEKLKNLLTNSTVQKFWRRMKSKLLETENSYDVADVWAADALERRYTRWVIDIRECVRVSCFSSPWVAKKLLHRTVIESL